MIYKILKPIFAIITTVMFVITFGLSVFIYLNPTTQFTEVYKPLANAQVYKGENYDNQGVSYGGEHTNEISSVDDIEKHRQNTKQRLYLKSRLIIPDLKVNLQIFEGTSDRVLTYGAGTIKPGQDLNKYGNYAVAAHNFADWNYGRGMSALQPATNVNGMLAYVSDDEYVYTYKLISKDVVPREDSMVYTEDDFPQTKFANSILNTTDDVKPTKVSELRQSDNSIKQLQTPEVVNYAKLLTLYTCQVDPPYYNTSLDRILVTGVQVKKEKLENVNGRIKELFVQEKSEDNNKSQDNKNDNENQITNNVENKENFILQHLHKGLRNDAGYVQNLWLYSLIISIISTFIYTFISKKTRDK